MRPPHLLGWEIGSAPPRLRARVSSAGRKIPNLIAGQILR
jgi:hypothetical protein